MTQKYTIPVVTRLQDNGDGGYTMYVYNSHEEMLADHPKGDEWSKERGCYQRELTEEEKEEILSGDDEYENGYLGQDRIEIEIVDGVAQLAKSLHFSAGQ